MLAAVEENWSLMFLWLVLALIVDGVDGPLARRFDVRKNWPTYDGVLMDLIVDYLTYVFIPAFALFKSGLLPGWTGWLAIIVICYGSVVYFAATRMKTKDKSFAGFPACWNMVVLVLFATEPSQTVILLVVILLTVTMFTNLKFIHPVRTSAGSLAGCIAGSRWPRAAWWDFRRPVAKLLVLTSLYLCWRVVQQVPEGIRQCAAPARHDFVTLAATRRSRTTSPRAKRRSNTCHAHQRRRRLLAVIAREEQPTDQHREQDRGLAQRRHHRDGARSSPNRHRIGPVTAAGEISSAEGPVAGSRPPRAIPSEEAAVARAT
jgi:phosphatidylcholine synthase